MMRIDARELDQHADQVLDRVKAGETIEITERGEIVALLTPPPAQGAYERLVAEGKIIPATAPWKTPQPIPRPPASPSLSEILDELREERLP